MEFQTIGGGRASSADWITNKDTASVNAQTLLGTYCCFLDFI